MHNKKREESVTLVYHPPLNSVGVNYIHTSESACGQLITSVCNHTHDSADDHHDTLNG